MHTYTDSHKYEYDLIQVRMYECVKLRVETLGGQIGVGASRTCIRVPCTYILTANVFMQTATHSYVCCFIVCAHIGVIGGVCVRAWHKRDIC